MKHEDIVDFKEQTGTTEESPRHLSKELEAQMLLLQGKPVIDKAKGPDPRWAALEGVKP